MVPPARQPGVETTRAGIPVIDLERWFSGGPAGERVTVDAVRRVCENIGFFLVRGHRVDPLLIDRMYRLCRAFFDLPGDHKARYPSTGPAPGGFEYFAFASERLAATQGEITPPDLKEAMDFGPGFGGGPWPERPDHLEEVWRDYYASMSVLGQTLRFILARAADLPEDYFEDLFVDHLSSVRAINYPDIHGEAIPGQFRAGAHSDYGFLTVLLSEDRPGGLEVRNRAGEWLSPRALPGTFIVNLGDTLMRWTDGMWQSTLHRVANPPAGSAGSNRRQSIAFFHNPKKDALIDTLPTFVKPGAPPRYPPITYGEYALDRQLKTHADQVVSVT